MSTSAPHPLHKKEHVVRREASTYMTDPQAERFCEIFAEGLESGIGYSRILSFLERKGFKGDLVTKLGRALLEEGSKLGETLARYGILDPAARKLLLVAEDQGTLASAFMSQAPLYRKRYENKKKVIFSLVEPIVLIMIAFGVLLPIVTNIRVLFEAEALTGAIASLLIVPMSLALFFFMAYIVSSFVWLNAPVESGLREVAARMWYTIPGISIPGRLNAQGMFCRYMCASIRGGMNIYESVQLAAEASNDPRLMGDLDRAFDELDRGSNLFDALSKMRALEADVLEYVGIGEETGRMSEMLDRASELYFKRSQETFERYMTFFTNFLRLVTIVIVFAGALFGVMTAGMSVFGEVFNSAGALQ